MKDSIRIPICLQFFVLIMANLMLVFSASPVYPDDAESKENEFVAVVNGENITRTQLADFLIDSFGKEGMDILIRRVLVDQEAKKQDIKLSEKEVNERTEKLVELEVNKLKNRYGSENQDAFASDLTKMGYDEDTLRKKLTERVEIDVRPQLLAEKLIKNTITITEEELLDVYEEKYGEKIQVRQIVVKTKGEAEELIKKIKGGADFETLAKDKSIDRPSAAKGGLMDPINKRSYLGKAIASLHEGDIADAIQFRDGYHVLKIEGKAPPAESKSYKDALPEVEKIAMNINLRKRSGPWFLNLIENSDIKNFLKK